MKLALALVLSIGTPLFAHRLDEYLQATIISLETNRVEVFMRLIPGVAVSSSVLASIHGSGNDVISIAEQRVYTERVLRDVSLSVDGTTLRPAIVSIRFPSVEQMKQGVGEIHIELKAVLPATQRANRILVWQNHHQSRISAYLVNSLRPHDSSLRIMSQERNENQSYYQVTYIQNEVRSGEAATDRSSRSHEWSDPLELISLAGLAILCCKEFVNAVA